MNSTNHKKQESQVSATNQRRYPRVNVRLPVRFWLDPNSRTPDYKHGHTENISAGGVLLRCFGLDRKAVIRLIREESELCLNVKLQDDDEPVPAFGRVLRAADCGGEMLLVVRFTRMDPAEHDRIHEFMLPHYPPLVG